jgi:hypothetical protein
MEEVGKEEIQLILKSFQKDKNLGPDGLPMELFLRCYEFIEEDLRRMVESSRIFGKTLGAFNTTFITLVPKDDNPSSFQKFRPMSLSNCIQ